MRQAYHIEVNSNREIMLVKINKSVYVMRLKWFNTLERFISKLSNDYRFNDKQIAFLKDFYDSIWNYVESRREIMMYGNDNGGC